MSLSTGPKERFWNRIHVLILSDYDVKLAVGEFHAHILGGYGWNKEASKGHSIGILKLGLFWIFKSLYIQ